MSNDPLRIFEPGFDDDVTAYYQQEARTLIDTWRDEWHLEPEPEMDDGNSKVYESLVSHVATALQRAAASSPAPAEPTHLDCPMCNAPKSFVTDANDPALGYCCVEKTSWRIADNKCSKTGCFRPRATFGDLCMDCLAKAVDEEELTPLQKVVIEHDDDMARLDRNTLAHVHCWHERVDAASYCCGCEDLPHAPIEPLQPTGEQGCGKYGERLDRECGLCSKSTICCHCKLAVTTPATPVNAAMRAAEEVIDELDRRALLHDSRGDRPIYPAGKARLVDIVEPIITRYLAVVVPSNVRTCGFCGKTELEVKVLIQAPVGYICEKCVAICASMIAKDAATPSPETPVTQEVYVSEHPVTLQCNQCGLVQVLSFKCPNEDGQLVLPETAVGGEAGNKE